MFTRRLAAIACLAVFAIGCGGVTDPSKNTIETFTGTIPIGNTGPMHEFTASKNGELIVTVKSLTPPTGNPVGLWFGQPSTGSCVAITNTLATAGPPAVNGPINKGTYCVVLQDIGGLAQAVAYVMTVSHP